MNLPDPLKFTNPFPLEGDYDPNIHARIMSDMPKSIKDAVTDCHRGYGSKQTIINILWLKLINSLDQHGITDFTQQQQFEQFIANIRIIDGRPADVARSTIAGVVSVALTSHVNGGEARVVDTNQDTPPEPPNSPRTTRSRGGDKSTGNSKKKKSTKVKSTTSA